MKIFIPGLVNKIFDTACASDCCYNQKENAPEVERE